MKKQLDESVRERLRKIAALAKQGCDGEAKAASLLLKKQLEKYGLTLEDMLDEAKKRREFRYANISERRVLVSLLAHHFGSESEELKGAVYAPYRKVLIAEMTDADYADLSAEWEHYRREFNRERKKQEEAFLIAFVSKYNLYDPSKTDKGKPLQELSEEELEVLRKAIILQMGIDDNPYHKMLEK